MSWENSHSSTISSPSTRSNSRYCGGTVQFLFSMRLWLLTVDELCQDKVPRKRQCRFAVDSWTSLSFSRVARSHGLVHQSIVDIPLNSSRCSSISVCCTSNNCLTFFPLVSKMGLILSSQFRPRRTAAFIVWDTKILQISDFWLVSRMSSPGLQPIFCRTLEKTFSDTRCRISRNCVANSCP